MRKLLLVLFLASLSHAAETYVVCAGVEQYDDARISALKYAVADARAVAQAFRAAGVAHGNVTLLASDDKNPARRPTRINVVKALSAVRQRAEAGDRLIVFFAGHGIERDGQQYLLTVDAQADLIDAPPCRCGWSTGRWTACRRPRCCSSWMPAATTRRRAGETATRRCPTSSPAA